MGPVFLSDAIHTAVLWRRSAVAAWARWSNIIVTAAVVLMAATLRSYFTPAASQLEPWRSTR